MLRTLPILLLLAAPAFAQPAPTPPQEPPKNLELPTDLVVAIRQYLATKPYGEVSEYISLLAACAAVQVPQNGMIRDSGQCPAASAAIRATSSSTATEPVAPAPRQGV